MHLARGDHAEADDLISRSLEIVERAEQVGWVGVCAALLLPAITDDPERYDHTLERARAGLEESGFADPDAFDCAASAAASLAGERGRDTWALALTHAERLGDAGRIRRARAGLAAAR